MGARFRSSWQTIRKPLAVVGFIVACALGIALIVGIIGGYLFNWDWVGVGLFHRGKTLWDWLQLLIIPVVLAIGGFWLNQMQKNREEKTAKHRTEIEQGIAHDNQMEAMLQLYLDRMSELLLEKNLTESEAEAPIWKIARARTLTVLRRLDPLRKGSLLQFLYESGLSNIEATYCLLDLKGADLSRAELSGIDLFRGNLQEVNLSYANLSRATLSRANLSKANLEGADLREAALIDTLLYRANLCGADLSGAVLSHTRLNAANLIDADLTNADLSRANLKGAKITREQLDSTLSLEEATMPDGSEHP